MGKIAELLEKKALGTITEAELKELNTLLAEAKVAKEADADDDGADDEVSDEEVDKLAQKLVSSISDKMDEVVKTIEKTSQPETKTTIDANAKVVVDKTHGTKTLAEAAEIKVVLDGRKEAGKKVTEVSLKTVHFAHALANGNKEKLQLLSEGTAAEGGYLVPEEFANMITEDIRDLTVMRNVAAPQLTISGDTLHLPALTGRPKAQWRSEKAVKHTSTAQFGENVFTPYSLASIVGLSSELASDASLGVGGSIVNYVAGLIAQAIAETEDKAFWVGSGSGQPSGVDGGVYSLRSVVAGTSDESRADAIKAAFIRTPQGYRNRGVWVANSGTLENISQLKNSQGDYLLKALGDNPFSTLSGRPVFEQNDLAGGTALFGDFGFYQIVEREGISVKISDEATVAGQSAFERNLVYVRVEKRVDGELRLPAAVTKVTGLGTP